MEQIPQLDIPTFWLVVAYIVIRDALIPLSNKLIPAKVQQQADKEARESSIEERETKALEEISKAVTQSAERLNSIETGQSSIFQALKSQSEALVILVDRVSRKTVRKS
jgi:precorrin-4 methylase